MKKIFLTAGTLLLIAPLAFAAFNDVQLSSGSTIQITVGDSLLNFTVANGNVQDLQVNAGNLLATLAPGSSVDITSADRKSFTYTTANVSTTFTCGSTSSQLTINLGSGAASNQSITVTPTTGTCVNPDNTGGGGNPYPELTPQPVPQLAIVNPTPTTTPVAVPPVSVPASEVAKPSPVAQLASPVFNRDLSRGQKNDDVKRLQQLLSQDSSIYPERSATGFFGPATERAIKRFQKKYHLPQVGRVGSATRKKLQEVFGAQQPTPSVVPPSIPDLQQQLLDAQKKLQDLLKQQQPKSSY